MTSTATPEGSTAGVRYGWLGGKQRSAETVSGAVLMGGRLYDASAGRFLSADPEYDGSFNSYEYCHGDQRELNRRQWTLWGEQMGMRSNRGSPA
jgi:RHS repeat-associated protein